MENFSDILVLLLIVVASAISSIHKCRKSVSSSQVPQSPTSTPAVPNTPLSQHTTKTSGHTSIKKEVAPPTEAPSRLKNKDTNSPQITNNEKDIEKIIDDFDLRTAIIYTEILTPKYKEY